MTEARIMGGTLAAFFALTAWVGVRGVPGIEEGLHSAVGDTLARRGIPVGSVSVRGRTVTVTGGPEAPQDRLALSVAVNSVPGVRRIVSRLGDVGRASASTSGGGPIRLADASADQPGPMDAGAAGGGGSQDPGASAGPALAAGDQDEGDEAATHSQDEGSNPGPPPAEPALSCEERLTLLADGRTLPFLAGESALAEADRTVLTEIASALRRCGEWTLTVVGFAGRDERRDAWALADRRAYAVARLLMDRGVDESRVATVTGNSPLDSEGEPRVELVVSGGM